MTTSHKVVVEVQEGDAVEYPADILVLKYAQNLFGADLGVYERLRELGHEPASLPGVNASILLNTMGLLSVAAVLFIGVVPLRQFGYQQIREFGRKALASLPNVKHLALTIHGPGYGLDEVEAFESELAGVIEALEAGDCPDKLERISFVELNPGRASRLKKILSDLIPEGLAHVNENWSVNVLGTLQKETLRTAGHLSAAKPHVFVAMPFADTMDDVFHYGIQSAVKTAGFLCERADLASFVGDIMEWVKQRISTAAVVIADLTAANPNVYLEVGYAWGCGRPTILVARDISELTFDVKGQRCLIYKSIKQLEELLKKELAAIADLGERDEVRTGNFPPIRLSLPVFHQLAILVLDGSGSMAESTAGKITKAQAVSGAVRDLFTYFRRSRFVRNFSFAVVTFDEHALLHTPVTAAANVDDDGDYNPLRNHGGATDIATGLLEAKRIAGDFLRKAPPTVPTTVTIVVMSDGEGGNSEDARRIAEEVKRNPAITICSAFFTTSGGADAQGAELLRSISSEPTSRNYKSVTSGEHLRSFFISSLYSSVRPK